jgi:hypothetical protein
MGHTSAAVAAIGLVTSAVAAGAGVAGRRHANETLRPTHTAETKINESVTCDADVT